MLHPSKDDLYSWPVATWMGGLQTVQVELSKMRVISRAVSQSGFGKTLFGNVREVRKRSLRSKSNKENSFFFFSEYKALQLCKNGNV